MSARDGSITKSDVKARLVRYVFSDFFGRNESDSVRRLGEREF